MAASTMDMAPMLCVLFLATRMRALQMDPVHGNPQRWAQNCFYLCTYAIIVQTCVAVFVPLVLGGKVQKGRAACDMVVSELDMMQGYLAKGLSVLRFLIMLCVYTGALAVVCAVFTMEHPDGKEHTIPVSPMMQCVINLSFQYFFIYILVWVFYTIEHFSGYTGLAFIKDAMESAKATVQFAPMLCVLFIATRMRALQITDNRGAPQGYVQDGMYLASWAVLVQFVMCLIMPFMTGEKFEVRSLAGAGDEDKPVAKDHISNYWGGVAVQTIRYTAVVALFGGTAAVITGVCLMTPETANGRGSMPLVGDYVEPAPSVTQIPGMEGAMKTTGQTIGQGADVVQETGKATGVHEVTG